MLVIALKGSVLVVIHRAGNAAGFHQLPQGPQIYVSQIMSGKRGVSRAMAKKLGEYFDVDASLFFT